MRQRTVWTPLLVVVGTILAACGNGAVEGSTTTTLAATTTTVLPPTTMTSMATTSTDAGTTSTSTSGTTTTGAEEGEGAVPGEAIDFGPVAGETLAVVGVAHDDVLNLRAAPGADQEILEGIPPLHDALTALGHTRQLPNSMWIEVDFEGTDGWVNLRFIAYLGDTNDVTAAIVDGLGEVPGGETMLELGMLVAGSVAGDTSADIVMSVAPTVGDLGEITFDITGFEDDSVRGGRYHIFGQPIDEAFVLDAVEATLFCSRGVDDGACI